MTQTDSYSSQSVVPDPLPPSGVGVPDQRAFSAAPKMQARRRSRVSAPIPLPPVGRHRSASSGFPGLHLSERRLLLLFGDLFLVNVALLTGLRLAPRTRVPWGWGTVQTHLPWFITLSLLWFVAAAVLDTYDLKIASSPYAGPFRTLKTLLPVAVAYFLVPVISAPLTRSRLSWALFLSVATVGLVLWRVAYAQVLAQPIFRYKALIVGAGWAGQTLARAVRERLNSDYELVGFLDDAPDKQGQTVAGLPVLGPCATLLETLQKWGATEVIVAVTHRWSDELLQALMDCQERGIQVTPMPVLYERITGRVAVEHIGQRLHLLFPGEVRATKRLFDGLKRLSDVALAAGGLAISWPLWLLIALAIRLDSEGPIFYIQERVGKGGHTFRVIKFRTMVQNAEEAGQAVWATENDPRVTRVGRLLRRMRLDELPQLINVLRGEMSMVGPRPERPQFVGHLAEEIPFYRARHAVRPGLTG